MQGPGLARLAAQLVPPREAALRVDVEQRDALPALGIGGGEVGGEGGLARPALALRDGDDEGHARLHAVQRSMVKHLIQGCGMYASSSQIVKQHTSKDTQSRRA